MKTKAIIILFFALTLSVISCKKTTDKNDLTTGIVGRYTNTTESTEIIVNKVSNTSVSISITTGSGSGQYSVAFPTATMNSSTSFTLNPVTQDGTYCSGTEKFSGTGTYTNNNISLFLTVDGVGTGTYNPCGDWTDNISASK